MPNSLAVKVDLIADFVRLRTVCDQPTMTALKEVLTVGRVLALLKITRNLILPWLALPTRSETGRAPCPFLVGGPLVDERRQPALYPLRPLHSAVVRQVRPRQQPFSRQILPLLPQIVSVQADALQWR